MLLKNILLLIVLFPLLGFIVNIFFYKKLKRTSGIIATAAVALSFFYTLFAVKEVYTQDETYTFEYFNFLHLSALKIPFSLLLDRLNALYLCIITGIGTLIHLYSTAYMKGDKAFGKYFAYLNLFIVSMLLLVMGANYLILFIGWEGVGLCSFLLIGFWHEPKEHMYAARKAFIMNRVGDLCFLLAMFLLIIHFGSLEFKDIAGITQTAQQPEHSGVLTAVTLLMFLGATGKSAQIPLYTWLPDAMAGPTPVSALIHAATMVTAGIYLITRSYLFFQNTPWVLDLIAITGLITALVAALIATKQTDIKKILAYSTVSQLGFMFMALGTGNFVAAVFHVITHAFFKALLFLGSGSVIHAMHGTQDITKMGGLSKKLMITQICFLIGCLAIAGIPGFSGFFSKDAILLSAFTYHPLYFSVALFTALLTAFYMFRMYVLTFHGTFRGTPAQEKKLHESPWQMFIPLIILALLAVCGGYIDLPRVLGGHALLDGFLEKYIPQSGDPAYYHGLPVAHSHSTEYMLMFLPVVLIIAIILCTFHWYRGKALSIAKVERATGLSRWFVKKFYVDECYDYCICRPLLFLGQFFNRITEWKIIDAMVMYSGNLLLIFSGRLRYWQSGKIGLYFFWMVVGMIVLFSVLLFK